MIADFALLNTLASFAAVAAAMYLTCRVDRYGTLVPAVVSGPTPKETA